MIRSSIGIVCALVLITTCAQSTAAQMRGEYSLSALRGRVLQTQLSHWIELADQGISARILSSDAYHDEFRFRAAPVKQSRNWRMPIVDVRPAKDISIASNQRHQFPTPDKEGHPFGGNEPVFRWVWQSPSNLAVRYSQFNAPFAVAPFNFIPRPLPKRTKPSEQKILKLKLVKATPTKQELAERKRVMTTRRKDYWNYYRDCDRWGVVFAIPSKNPPKRGLQRQQVVESQETVQPKSRIALALQDLAAQIAQRFEAAIEFYQTISKEFLISQS